MASIHADAGDQVRGHDVGLWEDRVQVNPAGAEALREDLLQDPEPHAAAHQSAFERASSVYLSCFSFDLASFIFIQTKSPSV